MSRPSCLQVSLFSAPAILYSSHTTMGSRLLHKVHDGSNLDYLMRTFDGRRPLPSTPTPTESPSTPTPTGSLSTPQSHVSLVPADPCSRQHTRLLPPPSPRPNPPAGTYDHEPPLSLHPSYVPFLDETGPSRGDSGRKSRTGPSNPIPSYPVPLV